MENKINFGVLFKSIDPPEGGLHGLREKMDRIEKKRTFISLPRLALVSTLAVAVLAALVITPGLLKPGNNLFTELVNNSENPAFIKYGYMKRSGETVSIPVKARSQLAVMQVETGNKNIKFYLIESLVEPVPGPEETM